MMFPQTTPPIPGVFSVKTETLKEMEENLKKEVGCNFFYLLFGSFDQVTHEVVQLVHRLGETDNDLNLTNDQEEELSQASQEQEGPQPQ